MVEDDGLRGLVQLDALADRADGEVDGAEVGHHVRQLLVLLGGVVERNAVGRQRHLAREEGAVVVDVEPAFRARNEGVVERLGVVRWPRSVSGLLIATTPFSSTILPPWLHSSQWA